MLPLGHRKLVDIGVNLTDPMFRGVYHGKEKHKPDIDAVLQRAVQAGVHSLIITGVTVDESRKAVDLCQQCSTAGLRCFATVGCHPTHCEDFLTSPDEYYTRLDELIQKNHVHRGGVVAAVGEIGLDFDRLHFCSREVQEQYFDRQLELAAKHRLPLFLHDRNSSGRFLDILSPKIHRLHGGVVHSFTGTEAELNAYLRLGLYIGVNGCSLKTDANLRVVKLIPLDRVMIETDCPWCEIKNTHASKRLLEQHSMKTTKTDSFPVCKKEKFVMGSVVKGRCEPCRITEVLTALYVLHQDQLNSIEELAQQIFENTLKLFPLNRND